MVVPKNEQKVNKIFVDAVSPANTSGDKYAVRGDWRFFWSFFTFATLIDDAHNNVDSTFNSRWKNITFTATQNLTIIRYLYMHTNETYIIMIICLYVVIRVETIWVVEFCYQSVFIPKTHFSPIINHASTTTSLPSWYIII